jgi:hypothetical protein
VPNLLIKGEKIPIKASSDEAVANEVLQLVQSKIDSVTERSPSRPAHHIALLALLDLGHDYVLARRDFESVRERILKRIDQIEEGLR